MLAYVRKKKANLYHLLLTNNDLMLKQLVTIFAKKQCIEEEYCEVPREIVVYGLEVGPLLNEVLEISGSTVT